ncbi:MAG: AAA family ATPase [Waltera sp.]
MCEFKLEELEVFNFRKFENERYKLNPQMNVFAGKNGSGKTAVLEAACVIFEGISCGIQDICTKPICQKYSSGR